MQGDGTGVGQNGLSQPSHAEQKQERADDELNHMDGDARQRWTERQHDGQQERQGASRTHQRASPSTDCSDRKDDGQGLYELDKRSEERGDAGRPGMCPDGDH
jgi:hypothetical protein